ncbi:MAG: TIGR03016 family PEP-CTERM system-associated outer membrane protein, partial [Gammaproteobacteria bacterium]|nr:TIGR03016 family PEP-CTERM system-associated outer membrane protein [Gammaproteobacteria bacterium]
MRVLRRCVFGVLLAPCLALGAEFDTRLSAGWSETYTDNVTAAAAGGASSEWVRQLTPGVSIKGEGRHLSLAVDYRLQDISYSGGAANDAQFHQLDATANVRALNDQLKFGVHVTHSQQIIDEQGTVSNSNITATNNRTNVGTISLSPALDFRLGNYAVVQMSGGYDQVAYQTGVNPGGANKSLALGVSSGTRFNTLGWSLTTNASQDGASAATQRSMNAQLNYRVGAKTTVFAATGYENNDFQSADQTKGSIWSVGANWQVGPRTSLNASIGNRYFSRTYSLAMNHAMRRSSFSLNYNQSLQTTSSLQIGQPVFDDTGTFLVGFGVPVEQTDVFITSTLSANYSLSSRRAQFGLGFNQVNRESSRTKVDDVITTLTGSAGMTFPSSTSVSLNASYRSSEFGLSGRVDDFVSLGVSVSRRLRSDVTLNASFQQQAQVSTDIAAEFIENALTLSVGFT